MEAKLCADDQRPPMRMATLGIQAIQAGPSYEPNAAIYPPRGQARSSSGRSGGNFVPDSRQNLGVEA